MAKNTKKSTIPVFVNNYPSRLLHKREAKTVFNSISFRLNDGWASFTLPLGMSKPATRRDGSVIDGCMNLFLGDADKTHNVSVRKADGSFDTFEMTNQAILEAIQADRAAYQASVA